MLISLNLIANPGDLNNRRKPLEIRNDPFPPVSSKVNLVNARELPPGPPVFANMQTCNINVIKVPFKAHVYRSALSDIKCEAQAERFISDNARLQVL